jgi:quinol monooxygenase YgiN
MRDAIRSLAVLKPHPGQEVELIALLREFYSLMYTKQYSRDILYRDSKQQDVFIHLRIWLSAEAREDAMHDPEVHRYWMKMPELGAITILFEELDQIFSTQEGLVEDLLEGGV